jgi:MFS family permease
MLSEFRGYSFPFLFWSAVAFVVSFLSIVMLKGMWSVGRRKPVVGEFGAIFFNTNIIIVCVLLVIGSACWGFVEAFYPKHLSLALGYHAGMIGILFTIAMLVYAPSRMVYGALSDKVGRKPVLIVGVLLSAIIIPFISMANTFTTIAICLAILFIAISQIYAAAFPLIADMVTFLKLKGEPYGAASGMGNLSWTLGFIIGPLTGGVIVEFLGLSRLCFIYALLLLTSALIGFLVIKEPKITEINPQK